MLMLRRRLRVVLTLGVFLLMAALGAGPLLAIVAPAPQAVFEIAIDTDNTVATGCDVTFTDTSGTSVESGFERLFRVTVNRAVGSPTVSSTEVQNCNGGAFGPPIPIDAGWPVGLNNGTGGADVVEAELPSALIGNPNFLVQGGGPAGHGPRAQAAASPQLRLAVQARTPAGGADTVLMSGAGGPLVFPGGEFPIPTLSEWGAILLAVFLAGAGLLLIRRRGSPAARAAILLTITTLGAATLLAAAVITLDGEVSDWSGIPVLANDPVGDSVLGDPAADIVAVFVAQGSLFFRIDVLDLEQDPPLAVDDSATTPEDTPVSVPVLDNDSDPDVVDTLTVQSVTQGGNGSVAIDAGNLSVTYTPNVGYNGPDTFTYTVRDNVGLTDVGNVDVNVTAVNQAPSFTSSPLTGATEDNPYSYSVTTTDPDPGDTRTIAAAPMTTLPGWLSLTDNGDGTATLFGTPATADIGDHDVTLRVTDAAGLFEDQAFTITVVADNMAPSFTSSPVTAATQDAPYTYNITTTDPDVGDTRTIAAAPMTTIPAWLTLTDNGDGTASLSGTPTNAEVGDHDVTLRVTDAGGLFADQAFTITVANVNDPPSFTSAPILQIGVGQLYSYAVTTTDIDVGDTRTIAAAPMTTIPAWLGLTDNGDGTATLEGTPAVGDVGNHDVTLRVQDAGGLFSDQMFTIEVIGPPDAVDDDPGGAAGFMVAANPASPLDTLGGRSVLDNDLLTGTAFIMAFQNPSANGGAVTVRADGTIQYDPATDFVGLDTFTYTLENSVGLTDTAIVTIQVGTAPTALDDTLTGGATGNVRRSSSGILNVLDNDTGDAPAIDAFGFDADAMGGIVGAEIGVTENGGQVVGLMNLGVFTGEFLYNPPPGFEGTDHFDYQISNPLGLDVGRVTVAVSDMVWFINNNAGAAGDGRLTSPFNTLALFDAANALTGAVPDPKAGDCIFLYGGGGNYTGGVSLRGSQILVGQGASGATTLQAVCGVTPPAGSDLLPSLGGTRPRLENTSVAGNLEGISLSIDNTVRGLDIGNTPNGSALAGTSVQALSVSEVALDEGTGSTRTGGAANLSGGPMGVVSVVLDRVESSSAPADGIDISGLPAGSVFTVNGTTTISSPASDGVDLRTSSGATFTFTGNMAVTTSAAGARGFAVNGAGSVNVGDPMTNNGSTINSTNGPGLDVATTVLDLTFQSVSSASSATTGVNLSGATGIFRGNGGAISGATGNAFNVAGGSADIIYLGSVSNSSNRAVSVVNFGSGTVEFGGPITETGTGILLDNNDQGGVGTVRFRGGMALNTGANTAFAATNGGVVNVCADDNCGAGGGTPVVNTIGATTALSKTAVNITNTIIGPDGVTFRSVSVDAGSMGGDTTALILTGSGIGGFSITGTGSTPASGGTIENITDVDAVRFDNTGGPILLGNMLIQDIVASGDAGAPLQTRSGVDAIHGQVVMGGLVLDGTTIRRVSDNAINGGSFADGISPTSWNGLQILNSHLELSNRFANAGVGDDADEALVRINGITGTVTVLSSTFNDGAAALDLFTQSAAGTLDMTVQSSAFTDLYKEFGCLGVVPTVNVGRRAVSVQVEGAHDAVVRVGDPAQANAALGNTFINGFTASVVVLGQEGGMTPHTGDIDAVISENTFVVTDHLTGPVGCPGGSLAFNFPAGGVSLNPSGGTFEAIVSNNLFDQVFHAAGGLGQLTIGANTGGAASEFIVTGNEFRLPWDAAVQIRSENASGGSCATLFENNTYTSGMVGSAADDVGFSTPAPFQGMLVSVRNGGHLDLTVRNEDLPLHDMTNSPTKQTLQVDVQNQAGNLLNLFVRDSTAPFGYGFNRSNGTFNLYRLNPGNATPVDIMTGNGNTGGGGVAGTSPPTVVATGVITPSDTAPTLPVITIPLMAAAAPGAAKGSLELNAAQLQSAVDEAVARWIATGLSGADVDRLRRVSVVLADLPKGWLADSFAGGIRIDREAAGHGWFVDATPADDKEFAPSWGGARSGVDLLTVVLHEMGHVLGHADNEGGHLMSKSLAAGRRRVPERR